MTRSTPNLLHDDVESLPHPFRVLVVDDIPESLGLLAEVFEAQGFVAVSVGSGAAALQQLDRQEFHLIVADAMMPAMDGFQLCREVKRHSRLSSIPFIIYTGNYGEQSEREFALGIGVDAYVLKSEGLATLISVVNDICRRRYARTDTPSFPPSMSDERRFVEGHYPIVTKHLASKTREADAHAQTLAQKHRELQASEARYRNLFEHASIGIFVLGEHGTVLDVNAEGLSLLGYTRDEITSIDPLSFVEDAGTARSILQSGAFCTKEATLRRKDGATVDVELGVGPYANEHERKTLLYVLDITEQKRMRRQLLQADKMSLMGRLAASIAHDIRNPLAAITLNLQYLAKRLPADIAEQGSLNFALEGARRISSVIENTLNLARVTPPEIKPEQINTIVSQAAEFLRSAVAQKKLSLHVNLAANLPDIHVEARQIQQVILNIVQNALDCSPEGSAVEVSTCLWDDMRREPRVVVVILDRGPGIPQDLMRNLYEPFFTTKQGGTGLGLALSKQIMDKHHAEIRIERALGGGTIVRLLFPINSNNDGE